MLKTERCTKDGPDGKVCGKPAGTCIHDWKPTLFGARTEKFANSAK